jgi:hypothetical protein
MIMKTIVLQDINITKSELKKLSREFRTAAGRLLRTSDEEGLGNLRRFLQFIRDSPILYDFIQSKQVNKYNEDDFFNETVGRYNIPESKDEEIAFIYQLLKYGSEQFNYYHYFPLKVNGYRGSSSQIQPRVDNFNKDVVNPLVNYIEGYLQNLIVDMGDSEQGSIHIKVYGDFNGNVMNQPQESIMQKNNFNNTTIGGGISARDYTGDVTNYCGQPQTLAEAATEIQKLLKQLEQTYPTNTFLEQANMADEALRKIQLNPRLKTNILGALAAAGKEALKEAVDHPVMNVLMAGIEGWQTTAK